MGAYKPRTTPYDFQGLGRECLPWVFELAGKHGIRIIAMEVTDARHIDEIHAALESAGSPTGVMLQIGTRNAQNFELLKQVGQQQRVSRCCSSAAWASRSRSRSTPASTSPARATPTSSSACAA